MKITNNDIVKMVSDVLLEVMNKDTTPEMLYYKYNQQVDAIYKELSSMGEEAIIGFILYDDGQKSFIEYTLNNDQTLFNKRRENDMAWLRGMQNWMNQNGGSGNGNGNTGNNGGNGNGNTGNNGGNGNGNTGNNGNNGTGKNYGPITGETIMEILKDKLSQHGINEGVISRINNFVAGVKGAKSGKLANNNQMPGQPQKLGTAFSYKVGKTYLKGRRAARMCVAKMVQLTKNKDTYPMARMLYNIINNGTELVLQELAKLI